MAILELSTPHAPSSTCQPALQAQTAAQDNVSDLSQKASLKMLTSSSLELAKTDCTSRQDASMTKLVPDHENPKTSLTTQVSDMFKKEEIEIFVKHKLGENKVLSRLSIFTSILQMKSQLQ